MTQLEMYLGEDKRLSYSSARLLQGCEQKFVHYKVNKTDKDSDVEDTTTAFAIGTAFHKVLEDHGHENLLNIEPVHRNNLIKSELEKCIQEIGLEEKDLGLVHAMLIVYLRLRKRQGYKTIACEYSIKDDCVVGYIDLIEQDPDGGWWISDMKTAKTFWSTLTARLPKDRQINLYAAFAPEIAEEYNLDIDMFKGCRYLVTTKSAAKQQAREDYMGYVARMAGKLIKSYAIEIPIEKMAPYEVLSEHLYLHGRSIELRKGAEPKKNFGYCESYFKPCDYWSQCHGKEFTELKDDLVVEREG